MTTPLYIGLMSGTSLDGIDAVLVRFDSDNKPHLITQNSTPIPDPLKKQLLEICLPGADEINRMGVLDIEMALLFSTAVQQLLRQTDLPATAIKAIGCHGQTIRHHPGAKRPFTLQIGDPSTLAEQTGICVVSDFRRRDLAAGGQGAPLVPAFHAELFRHTRVSRIILNIGGMANITCLPASPEAPVSGYDTGPGNVLLDAWIQTCKGRSFDRSGDWARSGSVDVPLLTQMLQDPYFSKPPPKSTGRERFNQGWIEQQLNPSLPKRQAEAIQATLLELSAQTIAQAIITESANNTEVYLCGGGARNDTLVSRITTLLAPRPVMKTDQLGVPGDWVEAMAFAWLAHRCLSAEPGNEPAVTGAQAPRILGGIYQA